MSAVIKTETVLEGLKCCLNGHDCLSCPYSDNKRNCQKKLYKDATVIILSHRIKGGDAYDALMYALREK